MNIYVDPNQHPQAQEVGDYPIQYGISPEQEQANLVLQTDPSSEIALLEHKFRAETYNDADKKWERTKGVDPFMNNAGIFKIITRLTSVITNNSRFSNLTEKEISTIMLNLVDEVTILLSLNWKKWEIDKASLTSIVNMVSEMTFLILKRALSDGERRFLRGTITSNETTIKHIDPQQSRRKKFLGVV